MGKGTLVGWEMYVTGRKGNSCSAKANDLPLLAILMQEYQAALVASGSVLGESEKVREIVGLARAVSRP